MSFIHMVGMMCPPEKEEKLNKWYNERHVPGIMKFKGVKRAVRYKMAFPAAGQSPSSKSSYPKFLALYEFVDKETFLKYEKSPEHDEVSKDFLSVKDELGAEMFWRVQYESIKTWER